MKLQSLFEGKPDYGYRVQVLRNKVERLERELEASRTQFKGGAFDPGEGKFIGRALRKARRELREALRLWELYRTRSPGEEH